MTARHTPEEEALLQSDQRSRLEVLKSEAGYRQNAIDAKNMLDATAARLSALIAVCEQTCKTLGRLPGELDRCALAGMVPSHVYDLVRGANASLRSEMQRARGEA